MKINLKLFAALTALIILITACSTATKQDIKETSQPAAGEIKSEIKTSGQNIPAKKEKLFLTENNIKISSKTLPGRQDDHMEYPEVQGLIDAKAQDKINSDMKDSIAKFIEESGSGKQLDVQKDQANIPLRKDSFFSVQGKYNNVLSIIENFHISSRDFHENWVKTLVYDLNTGHRLQLKDIFMEGADYRSKINSNITEQIIRRNLDESNLCRPFEGIAENQEFYITKNEIVICFNGDKQLFNNTNTGDSEFRIPFSKLGGMVDIYDKYVYPSGKLYTDNKLVITWLPCDLEITFKQLVNKKDRYIMEAQYVQIEGINDKTLEAEINSALEKGAKELISDHNFINKAESTTIKKDIPMGKYGNSWVSGNFAGKLCIVQDCVEYIGEKHIRSTKSYCYDIKNAKSFTMIDLFSRYPDYRNVIVSETKRKIKEAGYNPALIRDFDYIAKKAVFYYTEDCIQLIFQRGAINNDEDLEVGIDLSILGEDSYKVFL